MAPLQVKTVLHLAKKSLSELFWVIMQFKQYQITSGYGTDQIAGI